MIVELPTEDGGRSHNIVVPMESEEMTVQELLDEVRARTRRADLQTLSIDRDPPAELFPFDLVRTVVFSEGERLIAGIGKAIG